MPLYREVDHVGSGGVYSRGSSADTSGESFAWSDEGSKSPNTRVCMVSRAGFRGGFIGEQTSIKEKIPRTDEE